VTITAIVTDDDGESTTASIMISVLNIRPEILNVQAKTNGEDLLKDERSFWIVDEDQIVNLHGG
jgi:hypothetical protein